MQRWLRRAEVWALAACWLLCSGGGAREAGGAARLEAEPPLAALTFDDGPRQDATGRLLEGLSLREVPATFFLVGSRVAGNEELLRTMAAGGTRSAFTPMTTPSWRGWTGPRWPNSWTVAVGS